MIRVSILALVIALSNAEASRRLLQTTTGAPAAPQTGTGVTPPEVPPPPATGGNPGAPSGNPPPVSVPPVSQQPPVQVPAQPQPQPAPAQPNPYQAWINYYCNPYNYDPQDCAYYQMMAQQYQYQPQPQGQAPGQGFGGVNNANPYCNPMSGMYDIQDCMQTGGFQGGFGGQGQAPGQGGINTNIPYCNPMSPVYDYQQCFEYSMMYPQQPAAPATPGHGHPHGNPNQAPVQPNRPGQVNPMNPYCNPYSGMYDIQDCYQSTYGFHI